MAAKNMDLNDCSPQRCTEIQTTPDFVFCKLKFYFQVLQQDLIKVSKAVTK
jgi:hypothetical protein